ncbi:MAG: DUF3047 domain-containing protein [Sphingopyxis sp.]|nr:DUF3047 domain-containing protein [Sphingopyxis sp.]
MAPRARCSSMISNRAVGAKRLALLSAFACLLAGQALANSRSNWVSDFRQGLKGWTVVQIDKKVPATRFEQISTGGIDAVQATAVKSMALLTRKVVVDLEQTPVVCWQWRVSNALRTADITRKTGDDQAARIYIGLKLPANSMSLGTRTKLAIARSRGGDLVPDGTINYVWDNRLPEGTVRPNVYTDRARVVVMQSGNAKAGQWVSERRNVAQDIAQQFKTSAGRVTTIAISSDTDNTGETVAAAFANLHFVGQAQACEF